MKQYAIDHIRDGVAEYIDAVMEEDYATLRDRMLDVMDGNIEIRDEYEEVVERYVNSIVHSIAEDHAEGVLFSDLGTLVDQTWMQKKLSKGVELDEFNRLLPDTDFAGDVYRIVYGDAGDDDWYEDESLKSYVFDTLENALRFIRSRHHFRHVRIFSEYVTPEDDELMNNGPDCMVYPPNSYGNIDRSCWMMFDFDGDWRYVNEDGTTTPYHLTWRQLAARIANLSPKVADLPVQIDIAFDGGCEYEGMYFIRGLSPFDGSEPISSDNPPSIDLVYNN